MFVRRRVDIRSVLVIGQSGQFDYVGTQACRVLRAEGLRVVVLNPNPAAVMTDPELADATYVEPITAERVERVIEAERPDALLPTMGGWLAFSTAAAIAGSGVLDKYDVELIGTSPRTSYGRQVRTSAIGAVEISVDALYDGTDLYIGGVMEHTGQDGESACSLPPITLGHADIEQLRTSTEDIARQIGVRGLVNVRFARTRDGLLVLEVSPWAARTVPFVSKATAVPLAHAAVRVALGSSVALLRSEGLLPGQGDGGTLPQESRIAVHMPGTCTSSDAMSMDTYFGAAFAKSQSAVGRGLPTQGRAFVTVANPYKRSMVLPVKALADLGFDILATEGTASVLRRHGVTTAVVAEHSDAVQRVANGDIDLVVDIASGARSHHELRSAAASEGVPCITTVPGLAASARGIEAVQNGSLAVVPLQQVRGARR
jgi:carbamoyl-phosphate synthase large subunit